MNKTIKTLTLASALPLVAITASALAHGQSGSGMGSMMGGAMMQQQMTKMHEQMQKNHELMQQIMNEPDLARRQSMMQQHMQSMHEQMHLMNPGTGDAGSGAQPPADMRERMNQMDMRLNMMQMMIEQMMQHQQQMQ